MHELGLTQEIVERVDQRVALVRPDAKVKRVVLEVGKFSSVLPDSIRFCFALCCEGTLLEGAELVIHETDGIVRCIACGTEFRLEQPYGQCACGSFELKWLQGQEFNIKEVEVI